MRTDKRKTIAFQTDRNGVPIQAGSDLVAVLNLDVAVASWTEVRTPEGVDIKGLLARVRDGQGFMVSAQGDGGTYFTVPAGASLELPLVKGDDEPVFYVKTATTDGTLEVLLVR